MPIGDNLHRFPLQNKSILWFSTCHQYSLITVSSVEGFNCCYSEEETDDGEYVGPAEEDYEEYDEDHYHSDDIIVTSEEKQKHYTVLTEVDIRELQEKQIDETSRFLSISTESACILLHQYKWIAENAHEAWFLMPKATRKIIGHRQIQVQSQSETVEITKVGDADLRKKARKKANKKAFCRICLEDQRFDDVIGASCGHRFCRDCWRAYFKVSVEDGRGCLSMRCPYVCCRSLIGRDFISTVASHEIKERYFSYLLRSYVEDGSKNRRKSCPAAGCDLAVEIHDGFEEEASRDVICGCGNAFCWDCHDESHRPVDCGTAAKWRAKNSSEEGNAQWLLENSKACPKCHKLIEKKSGCNHVVCPAPCKFEFCWLCLGKWATHGRDYYNCNVYEQQQREGKWSLEEKMKKTAEEAADRYLFYYERWSSNDQSRRNARKEYENLEKETLSLMMDVYGLSESDKETIKWGWARIADCRRLLMWTYVYGFYMEDNGEMEEKKRFFTYVQGEAEAALEKLHCCLEKEMVRFVQGLETMETCKDEKKILELNAYLLKVSNLNAITLRFFDNLIRAMENGLEDVVVVSTL